MDCFKLTEITYLSQPVFGLTAHMSTAREKTQAVNSTTQCVYIYFALTVSHCIVA